jgi:hypothetical protein
MQPGSKASTVNYGDVVLYNQNGKICNALVLQSQIIPVPDRSAPGGQGHEEHLTLTFLDPFMAKPQLTGIEMENAIKKPIVGVKEWSATNPIGWLHAKVLVGTESGHREYAGSTSGRGEREQTG